MTNIIKKLIVRKPGRTGLRPAKPSVRDPLAYAAALKILG
jgi:hypothetical protein